MNTIYQAAEEIVLVLPFIAPKIEPELRTLLKRASTGEDVETAILDLLNEQESTCDWLQDKLLEIASRSERSFSNLIGDSTTGIGGIKQYHCPTTTCSRKRFLHRVGQKIPICPEHQVEFVEVTTT